ncbi:MAG: N-acetyltransferase [Neomegalonema sp.]|nr:N-acetyltransferase [Neomegalonema sp.]
MRRIAQERPEDLWEIEQLFDLTFAPGRTALSSYQLRGDSPPIAELCMCLRDDFDVIVGAIRYWPIRIATDHGDVDALLLGPVAVHPTRQGEGIAAELILESLAIARARGWARVVLVGDAPYYRRFGFTRAPIQLPRPTNPERVLAKALVKGAMEGVAGKALPPANLKERADRP